MYCFYDTKEMREMFPKSYPNKLWLKGLIVPGQIISSDLNGFATTFIKVLKSTTYEERNSEIRRQMEYKTVYVLKNCG